MNEEVSEIQKTMRVDDSRNYFGTEDLVIIALFSSVGGIMSPYINYLASVVNVLLGVPFGPGQILSGLHIFWIIFGYLLTGKTGTPTIIGIVKGFVELFTGSPKGLLILPISILQGLVFDIGMFAMLNFSHDFSIILSSGLSSVSNIILQQILFFNNEVPLELILIYSSISIISGFILGGWLAIQLFDNFKETQLLSWRNNNRINDINLKSLKKRKVMRVISSVFLCVFIFGSTVYFLTSYQFILYNPIDPNEDLYSAEISGDVSDPFIFIYDDFDQYERIVEAELIGDVTHEPPQNYTGIPLFLIVNISSPNDLLQYSLTLIARDNYKIKLNSSLVNDNYSIIITKSETGLSLVADELHGSYWIKNIAQIIVE